MSSYSELIKNFEKIRAYMRDFYVYGFRAVMTIAQRAARARVPMMTSAAGSKAGLAII